MANAKEKTPESTEETLGETEATEEASEEAEEGSGDSGDESSEEGGEEGEEEEAPEQYFDLTKVPDNLKAVAKKMQATHTRKMQALALDARKAAALDDLMQHREFKLFLADLESGKPYGASTRVSTRTRAGEEIDEEGDEAAGVSEGKLDMAKIVKAITPVIREVVQESIAPLARDRGQEIWDKTREKHDDFDDYLPEITKLQKAFPNMALERAYRLAKAESDEPEKTPRKPTKAEVEKAKKARTIGAGAAKGGTQGLAPKTVNTLRDALKHAFSEQGIRVE